MQAIQRVEFSIEFSIEFSLSKGLNGMIWGNQAGGGV